jgi:hypothetical protein
MVQLKREKVKSEEQLILEKSTISLSEVYVLISQI